VKRDEIRAILNEAGIWFRRDAGQNFLVEENLAAAIARDGQLEPGDVALEIGTGLGILTRNLAPLARRVVTVELDEKMLPLAQDQLAAFENIRFLRADALANKNALNPEVVAIVSEELRAGGALRIVANLPYNVATPLVVGFLRQAWPLATMAVMVQLEAAQRFAARRGDPQYGAVSLLCRALCEHIEIVRKVPREVFMPRPKVTSAVIRFVPRAGREAGFDQLAAVVRAVFNYRRKTLGKAASSVARRHPELAWLKEALTEAGIDPKQRAEEVPLEAFQALAALTPP
jgi:16S rRNA (adenine1518-N6/adenine1519-N6)-dimethyltransferase